MAENNKKWMWVASSNDGAYSDRSSKPFASKRECYEDMRRAVLDKMTWNTEWTDFEGNGYGDNFEPLNEEGNYISYNVHFHPMEIVHTSYSGTYTYKVVEYKAEEILRLMADVHFKGINEDEIKHYEAVYEAYLKNCINEFVRLHPNNVENTFVGGKQHIQVD